MHEKFPQWYSSFTIQEDPKKLDLRASAVDEYLADVNIASVESLIRIAFATKKTGADAGGDALRQAFAATDPSFPDSDNDREMQVLAAITLACLMEGDDQESAFAAVAISTTSFGGARTAELPMDLPGLAEATIRRISVENGKRPLLGSLRTPAFQKLDFASAATHAMLSTEAGWNEAFQAVAAALRKDMTKLRDHQEKVLSAIEKFTLVQDEELQMLWWVVGGHSEIADAPFTSIPTASRPILLAGELSGHTEQLPGPASVRSLLSKGGISNSKKVTVTAALKSAFGLLKLDSLDGTSSVTQPLHFGLSRLAEVNGQDGWEANWSAVVGIPADIKLDPLDLAELYFREALLQRFLVE